METNRPAKDYSQLTESCSDTKNNRDSELDDSSKEISKPEVADGGMSHQAFLEATQTGIADIIHNDPLLCHLPLDVTIEELNSAIALEHGQAMSVIVKRADGGTYSVVVEQAATVQGLKKAIQRHFTLKQSREKKERTISWRYVWKTYWLSFEGQKLIDDRAKLKDYGIRNNSEINFVKRLRIR